MPYNMQFDNSCFELDEYGFITYTGSRQDAPYAMIIPSSINGAPVLGIQPKAFAYCTSIRMVVIPDSVKIIRRLAFYRCSSLESVSITGNLEKIGNRAFDGCMSLKRFDVSNAKRFSSDDGILYDKSKTRLMKVPPAYSGAFVIGKRVEEIRSNAFSGCSALTSIYADKENPFFSSNQGILMDAEGKTLIKVPASAKGTLVIDDNIETVKSNAFENCTILDKVIFGSSLRCIEDGAFTNSGIKRIYLPNTFTSVNPDAFNGADSLIEIMVDDTNESLSNRNGMICSKDGSFLYTVPAGISGMCPIPPLVRYIAPDAFNNCSKITGLVITKALVSADRNILRPCINLTKIYFGGSYSDWNRLGLNIPKDCDVEYDSLLARAFSEAASYNLVIQAAPNGSNGDYRVVPVTAEQKAELDRELKRMASDIHEDISAASEILFGDKLPVHVFETSEQFIINNDDTSATNEAAQDSDAVQSENSTEPDIKQADSADDIPAIKVTETVEMPTIKIVDTVSEPDKKGAELKDTASEVKVTEAIDMPTIKIVDTVSKPDENGAELKDTASEAKVTIPVIPVIVPEPAKKDDNKSAMPTIGLGKHIVPITALMNSGAPDNAQSKRKTDTPAQEPSIVAVKITPIAPPTGDVSTESAKKPTVSVSKVTPAADKVITPIAIPTDFNAGSAKITPPDSVKVDVVDVKPVEEVKPKKAPTKKASKPKTEVKADADGVTAEVVDVKPVEEVKPKKAPTKKATKPKTEVKPEAVGVNAEVVDVKPVEEVKPKKAPTKKASKPKAEVKPEADGVTVDIKPVEEVKPKKATTKKSSKPKSEVKTEADGVTVDTVDIKPVEEVKPKKAPTKKASKPKTEVKPEADGVAAEVVDVKPVEEAKPKKSPTKKASKPKTEVKPEADGVNTEVVDVKPVEEVKPKKAPTKKATKPKTEVKSEANGVNAEVVDAKPVEEVKPKKATTKKATKPKAEVKPDADGVTAEVVDVKPVEEVKPKKSPTKKATKPKAEVKPEADGVNVETAENAVQQTDTAAVESNVADDTTSEA